MRIFVRLASPTAQPAHRGVNDCGAKRGYFGGFRHDDTPLPATEVAQKAVQKIEFACEKMLETALRARFLRWHSFKGKRLCRPLRNHSATWPHGGELLYGLPRIGNQAGAGQARLRRR